MQHSREAGPWLYESMQLQRTCIRLPTERPRQPSVDLTTINQQKGSTSASHIGEHGYFGVSDYREESSMSSTDENRETGWLNNRIIR